MYGDDFLKRYDATTEGVTDDLPKLLDDNRIGWTLFAARARR